MELRDKVVILTGASAGIGQAAAWAFAHRGARLALVARSADRLAALAAELAAAGAAALPLPADVSRPEEAQAAVDRCVAHYGRLDVLVNNAGTGRVGPTAGLPATDWQEVFGANVLGAVHMVRAAVPHLRRQGGGIIVNVSSPMGKVVVPYVASYCASKAALDVITAALRAELAPLGIRVLEHNPGMTRTGIFARALGEGHPLLGRILAAAEPPEAVARRLVWQVEAERPVVYRSALSRLSVALRRWVGPRIIARFMERQLGIRPGG